MEVVLQSEAMLMPGVEIKKKFADYANNLFSEIIYGVCGKKCGIYMGRNSNDMYHSNYVGFYYGKGNVRYTPAGILLLCYNASATAFNSVCDDVSRALGEALIELNLATRYEKSDNVQRIVRFAGFNIEVPDNIILGKELEEVIERIYFGFELKMLSSECISYDKYSLVGTNNIGWFEIGYEDPVYSLAGFYLLLYNAYVYNEDVKSLNSKGQCRFFEATCKALVKLGFAECRE